MYCCYYTSLVTCVSLVGSGSSMKDASPSLDVPHQTWDPLAAPTEGSSSASAVAAPGAGAAGTTGFAGSALGIPCIRRH